MVFAERMERFCLYIVYVRVCLGECGRLVFLMS